MTTVEFANPWHDERGRFAPKGAASGGRMTTIDEDHRGGEITGIPLGDGRTGSVKMFTVGEYPPNVMDEGGDKALAAIADAMERNPLPGVDHVDIAIHDPLANPGSGGWCNYAEEGLINLNPDMAYSVTSTRIKEGHELMPSEYHANGLAYVATHEYGHLHDFANDRVIHDPNSEFLVSDAQLDRQARKNALWEKTRFHTPTGGGRTTIPPKIPGMSWYGQRDSATEGYAEAFADWNWSKGQSTDPATRAFAEAFGWQ